MRKKRFTAFLLSLAMAGTSLYTCGVIDVQAAAVAEEGTENPNLEQLTEIQEQAAAVEEEVQAPVAEEAEPEVQAQAVEEVAESEVQASTGELSFTNNAVVNGEAEWGTTVGVTTSDQQQKDIRCIVGGSSKGNVRNYTATKEDIGKTVTFELFSTQNTTEKIDNISYTVGKRMLKPEMIKFKGFEDGSACVLSYNGGVRQPELIISENVGGQWVSLNQTKGDYIPSYTDADKVGTASVTVKIYGNACATHKTADAGVTKEYSITEREISSVSINLKDKNIVSLNYSGSGLEPEVVVTTKNDEQQDIELVKGRDYSLSWNSNKVVGENPAVSVNLLPKGYFKYVGGSAPANFVGFTKDNLFDIISKNNATLTGTFSDNAANKFPVGKTIADIKAKLTVSDGNISVSDGDYTLKWKKGPTATDPGNGRLALGDYEYEIIGAGNYAPDSKGTLKFSIGGVEISENLINVEISGNTDRTFNGKEQTLSISSVSVSANGKTLSDGSVSYDNVTLSLNTGYKVTYKNNVHAASANAGEAKAPQAIIELTGDYSGSKIIPFTISAADLDDVSVSYNVSKDPMYYDGSAQKPKVTVDVQLDGRTKTVLTEGTDFVIADYGSSIDKGDVTCSISGCNDYTGKVENVGYTISPKNISDNDIGFSTPIKATYRFTGQEIIPSFELAYWNLKTPDGSLSANTKIASANYIYKGDNDGRMGTVSYTISGQNNYTGILKGTFQIISKGVTSWNVAPISYNGTEISENDVKSQVTLYSDDTEVPSQDYNIILNQKPIITVGEYPITISGTNNYDGIKIDATLKVNQKNINDGDLSINGGAIGYYYKGGKEFPSDKWEAPEITLSVNIGSGSFNSVSTDQYDFASVRTGATTGTYTLTGKDNYCGTKKVDFTLSPMPFDKTDIKVSYAGRPYVYTGEVLPVQPTDFVITDGKHGETLVAGVDYYIANLTVAKNAGKSDIKINAYPGSEYTGDVVGQYEVLQADISEGVSENQNPVEKISADYIAPNVSYNAEGGTFVVPEQLKEGCLSYNGMHLSANTDYNVYLRNENGEIISTNKYTDAGKYDIVAVGTETGNYKGVRVLGSLTVEYAKLVAENFKLYEDTFSYNGLPHKPAVIAKGYTLGTDFELDYPTDEESAERGAHDITVRGINNYKGSKVTLTFVVEPITLTSENTAVLYAGKDGDTPLVQVRVDGKTLTPERDYTVVSTQAIPNTDPQQWNVTISGSNAYEGTIDAVVTYGLIELFDENVSVSADFTYDGQVHAPAATDVSVAVVGRVLSQNTDYDVTVIPNDSVNAGEYTVTVTGKGAYTGTANGTYVIKPAAFTQENVTVQSSVAYTGTAVEPVKVVVGDKELVLNVDYTVDAVGGDMVNKGDKTLTITGIGNYAGSTATGTCTVTPASLTDSDVRVNVAAVTYTGAAQTAKVTSVVKGRLVLKAGVDYTVETKKATNAGTVKVKVTGKGNYTGTATGNFVINKKNLASCKISGVKDRVFVGKGKVAALPTSLKVVVDGKTLKRNVDFWIKYSDNTKIGQVTYTINGKGNYTGTTTSRTYRIYPKKAAIASLKAGKGRFTVTAKRQDGGIKYQVEYKRKGAKGYTRVESTKAKVVVKGLKKGKTYTVRVRTYKKVGGKNYYGAFSKTKNVKIK